MVHSSLQARNSQLEAEVKTMREELKTMRKELKTTKEELEKMRINSFEDKQQHTKIVRIKRNQLGQLVLDNFRIRKYSDMWQVVIEGI